MAKRTLTHAEWTAEAERRFGTDVMAWRFVCPACGHVAAVADWRAAGANSNSVAFACVGRWAGAKRDAFGLNPKGLPTTGAGPCNYSGGGLFAINPVAVTSGDGTTHVFEFEGANGG